MTFQAPLSQHFTGHRYTAQLQRNPTTWDVSSVSFQLNALTDIPGAFICFWVPSTHIPHINLQIKQSYSRLGLNEGAKHTVLQIRILTGERMALGDVRQVCPLPPTVIPRSQADVDLLCTVWFGRTWGKHNCLGGLQTTSTRGWWNSRVWDKSEPREAIQKSFKHDPTILGDAQHVHIWKKYSVGSAKFISKILC